MSLSITTATVDDKLVVSVAGELDVSNAPELREALEAAEADDAAIEVDIAEVPYMDSTGIGVFVGTVRPTRAEALRSRTPSATCAASSGCWACSMSWESPPRSSQLQRVSAREESACLALEKLS